MRGLAGSGPRWSPSGWQEGCALVWGTPCKLWGVPDCKELDPTGDVVEGLPADERVSESDHRFGLASGHGTAEQGFTLRGVVREDVTKGLAGCLGDIQVAEGGNPRVCETVNRRGWER